ncbi:MAG: protein-L-isoaspartate(D-aspartate) O-methyltransferase [Ignavibacteria bacterium]
MDLNTLKRKELVAILYSAGIKDNEVLKAIGRVKRHLFVKNEFIKYAYDNTALPLDSNQTISQPFTVAFMTELLNIKQGDKVLEIGTGSGYQSAVLKELGADVYTIERIKELSDLAKEKLSELGYDVHLKNDDGTKGWEEFAPFNNIIVTAGSPKIPRQLLDQLAVNGLMIIPVGDEALQELVLIKKVEVDEENITTIKYKSKKFKDFKFVPLIGEEGWKIN